MNYESRKASRGGVSELGYQRCVDGVDQSPHIRWDGAKRELVSVELIGISPKAVQRITSTVSAAAAPTSVSTTPADQNQRRRVNRDSEQNTMAISRKTSAKWNRRAWRPL